MKNKTKLTVSAAVLLSIMLTGCAERGTQSDDPAAFAKRTYSYSISNNNESKPSEESSGAVAINGDVMWGLGKTVEEVSEKYGDITGGAIDVYMFENGYGKYAFHDGCDKLSDVSAKDLLVGDLSTVTLDNIAEKCGFNVVPLNPTPDGQTMYDGYKMAYYTHPSYENVMFGMFYKESGFDETASFYISLNSETPAITEDFINTLNSVIDTAADVDALNSGIRSVDTDALISGVRVFEHPAAFEKNTLYTGGELNDGAVILVDLTDGRCYITSRGARTTEPVPDPMMFAYIVERADSVNQLKYELDGFNLGLGEKKATNVTLYQNVESANTGDDSGERIIHNGNLVADDDTLKKGGIIRVEYDGGQSFGIFTLSD